MSTTNDNSVITRGFLKAYHDRLKTTIPTKGSDLTNDLNWASGTVTSVAVKMNGTTKGTITSSGTIDLGTVITAHQDISGKANSNTAVSSTSTSNGVTVTLGGTVGAPTVTTSVSVSDLKTALGISSAMLFKGTLGTGGTITALPTAAAANTGFTYKVITNGTYASQAAKVGDVFISDGSKWVLVPSGDEPAGTVTSVGLSAPTGFSVTGSPVTSSGTLTLGFASGYSLPTTAKQTNWDTAYGWGNHASAGYLTEETDPVFVASAAHGITTADINNWNGKTSNTGTVTSVAVKMNNTVKGTVTTSGTIDLGTVITAHQDISGKTDKATLTTKGDMYYASAASTPARLAIGTKDQFLVVSSTGVPTWATKTIPAAANNATITLKYNDYTGAATNIDTFTVDQSSAKGITVYKEATYDNSTTSDTDLNYIFA